MGWGHGVSDEGLMNGWGCLDVGGDYNSVLPQVEEE